MDLLEKKMMVLEKLSRTVSHGPSSSLAPLESLAPLPTSVPQLANPQLSEEQHESAKNLYHSLVAQKRITLAAPSIVRIPPHRRLPLPAPLVEDLLVNFDFEAEPITVFYAIDVPSALCTTPLSFPFYSTKSAGYGPHLTPPKIPYQQHNLYRKNTKEIIEVWNSNTIKAIRLNPTSSHTPEAVRALDRYSESLHNEHELADSLRAVSNYHKRHEAKSSAALLFAVTSYLCVKLSELEGALPVLS